MLIQESNLVNSVKCPLYNRVSTDLEICALKVLRAALAASFNKNPIGLPGLRELFVKNWDAIWHINNEKIPESGPYWEGPKAGRALATRIHSLLLSYEVLQPIQPYELLVQTYTIQGEYALLKERGKSGAINVLVPHASSFYRIDQPEPTGLIRFWHVLNTFPMYKNVRIFHFPLLKGRNSWQDFKDLPKVLTYVQGIVLSYTGNHLFARTGSHCDSCSGKRCMEIFNGGSYDHSWQGRLAQIRDRRT